VHGVIVVLIEPACDIDLGVASHEERRLVPTRLGEVVVVLVLRHDCLPFFRCSIKPATPATTELTAASNTHRTRRL
jgi:hypothetical protein